LGIEAYFQRVRSILEACPAIQAFELTFDKRSSSDGFIRGDTFFVDGSTLLSTCTWGQTRDTETLRQFPSIAADCPQAGTPTVRQRTNRFSAWVGALPELTVRVRSLQIQSTADP
jgi:hypothetical protein